jgi:hypothetical protein
MSDGDHANAGLSRRELLSTAATAVGALVVGFWLPQPASTQIINPEGATWAVDPGAEEINGRRARRDGHDPHRPDRVGPGCVDLKCHDGL